MDGKWHTEHTCDPPLGPMYRRVLFTKRKGLKPGESLPPMTSAWKGLKPDVGKLKEYRDATGMPPADTLPLLYGHVLTAGLHIGMVSDPRFPFSALGMVHARQHVLLRRPIRQDETLDTECRIAESRVVKAGLEFDVTTAISSGGEMVCENLSTYLIRGKYGDPEELPAYAVLPPLGDIDEACSKMWNVPKNMGRRYARIARDYNPIHISSILAKLFGFPRSLIHGMWSAAKALSELPALPENQPLRCDLIFKGPIFIGSSATLNVVPGETAHRFDVYATNNPRPCVVGQIQTVSADAAMKGE